MNDGAPRLEPAVVVCHATSAPFASRPALQRAT